MRCLSEMDEDGTHPVVVDDFYDDCDFSSRRTGLEEDDCMRGKQQDVDRPRKYRPRPTSTKRLNVDGSWNETELVSHPLQLDTIHPFHQSTTTYNAQLQRNSTYRHGFWCFLEQSRVCRRRWRGRWRSSFQQSEFSSFGYSRSEIEQIEISNFGDESL